MVRRRLGQTALEISPLGFGAFKIGRNQGIKYAQSYELPSEDEVSLLLNGVLDLGINYIDTAPAYGLSEQRIGKAIAHRKDEFVLSTKVGENFAKGESRFDFSDQGVRDSISRSRERLRVAAIDLVFVHSDGNDLGVINQTDVISALGDLKTQGEIRAIGFSGKTVEGARAALDWADAIMVEYHLDDLSHSGVIAEAAQRGVGIIVKKALASGRLPARSAIEFVLRNQNVASMVIGGLNLNHIEHNIAIVDSFESV